MNKWTVSLGVAVIAVAVFASQLMLDLREERMRRTALQARVTELELQRITNPAVTVPQPAGPAAAAPDRMESPAQPVNPAKPAGAAAQEPATGIMEAMQGQQGRDFARSMMRGVIAQMYPDVAAELQLTPQETEQLLEMLSRQQGDLGAESMALMAGSALDPQAMREMQRKVVDQESAHQRELAALLGNKYPSWQEYQFTAAARQQVEQLRTTLGAGEHPLSDAQSKTLVASFARELARTDKEERAWMTSEAAADSPDLMQESLQRGIEGQRRLLDVARPHLTSAQADQFKRQVEQQETMLRSMMGLMGAKEAAR